MVTFGVKSDSKSTTNYLIITKMKKIIFFSLMGILSVALTSCVESSGKYKALQARLDSLSVSSEQRNAEFEEVFETLNEAEDGLKSIRETENILVLQSKNGGVEVPANSREQMKSDIETIGEALKSYKTQIDKLKNDNRIQSREFKKRLAALTSELEAKSALIEDLSKQLSEKDAQLRIKSQQIASLDKTVATLREDVSTLHKESANQKEKIESQDEQINAGYYIIGKKSDLIAANVMSKGGLFRSAKISYQAEKSAFVKIDIREVSEIALNVKRAKVLSVHPTGTYALEEDADGMLYLRISNPQRFWEQTKYLVIQIQ